MRPPADHLPLSPPPSFTPLCFPLSQTPFPSIPSPLSPPVDLHRDAAARTPRFRLYSMRCSLLFLSCPGSCPFVLTFLPSCRPLSVPGHNRRSCDRFPTKAMRVSRFSCAFFTPHSVPRSSPLRGTGHSPGRPDCWPARMPLPFSFAVSVPCTLLHPFPGVSDGPSLLRLPSLGCF